MPRPLTPDLAEFWLQDLLLGTLKNESRTTKKILEAVPADKAEYRPDPFARTAMELVRHIAAAEMRFLGTTINAAFPSTAGLPESVAVPLPLSWKVTPLGRVPASVRGALGYPLVTMV